jgi:hypothetical protein
MKMTRTFFFFFILASSFSCKKDEKIPDPIPVNTTVNVQAGICDSSFTYHVFSPALKIPINWDTLNLYGSGSDSIDLNSDGSFEITILLSLLNYDSIHLLNGNMPNPFPCCKLLLKNDFEIAKYTETFPIGLGQTGTADFADTLLYNENINHISGWSNGGSYGINMWGENPGGAGHPSFGGWYSSNSIMYLGLRINGNKYGWIEADLTDKYAPVFIRYAFQK